MQDKIRANTNKIFEKIRTSQNKSVVSSNTTKLVDSLTESRYHIASNKQSQS